MSYILKENVIVGIMKEMGLNRENLSWSQIGKFKCPNLADKFEFLKEFQ